MTIANLQTSASVEVETDTLGGSRLLDSGIYNLTIKTAYLGMTRNEGYSFNIEAETPEGVPVRQTMYVTSGKAKGVKNTYTKNGKDFYLPDFITANAICELSLDKSIGDLQTEVKVIKMYDFESKKEMPTEVNMYVDLIGAVFSAGILKKVTDKNEKNGEGAYVATGETRESNVIDKIFRASDGLTKSEIVSGVTDATFFPKWKEKWDGKVQNQSKGVRDASLGGGGTAGAPGAPKKSLFN